jgi:putative phosphoesterase
MKIGFISDVHANLPALDVVINDLQNVDKIIHSGDIIGYNAFPADVIKLFQEQNIKSITGNHDRGVINHSEFDFPDPVSEVINWTIKELSVENKEFIDQLPDKLQLEIDGNVIQIVHGSPFNTDKYIYPTDISLELIEKLDKSVDILVWGHTHYPIITKINGVLLLNPGSVGQPRDGDWRTSYAIFDTQTGNIELRRREYDVKRTIEKAKMEKFPQQIIDMIYQPISS